MLFFQFKDNEKAIENHLNDIRKHLISFLLIFFIIFITIFYFSNNIYNILKDPLLKTLAVYHYSNQFIVTSLPEGFFSYVKMSFFITILLLIPIFLWQVLFYILPIISKRYRKEVTLILGVFAPILFYLGVVFAYFFTFYVVWKFFVSFNLAKQLSLYLKVSEYISLSLNIIVWSGLSFELPVILYILNVLGILSYKTLKQYRKIAILIAFIIAAIITPPDPFSQIIMAIILVVLYEVSLFFIKRRK